MEARRTRAKPGDGARLREEILRNAERLLVETGSEDALTLRAVAQRTRVTTPSVYLHFSGKEALIEAVCLRVWDELGNRIREAVSRITDPLIALGECGRAYVHFALDHPVQYRLLLMRPSASAEASRTCFEHMVNAVTACVESGVLKGNPDTVALTMWTAVHGCAALLITQPALPWPDDVNEIIDATVRTVGFGAVLNTHLPRRRVPRGTELLDGVTIAAERLKALGSRKK
ncbi:TetR/AcrR family transcriptional regulator [Allokutzneria multivorans]|uniref:TetR/AcrR family transcriptional regulator n=1 Tax=Allokutzneria multivorans TaxID=1142134 RepID=A0ABP7SSG6_9PSEU